MGNQSCPFASLDNCYCRYFKMIKEKFIVVIFLISGVVIGNNGNKFCKKMLKLGDVIDQKVDKILEKDSCCKTCNKRSEDYVVSGDVYSDTYKVENLLTWSIPEQYSYDGANYWLAPDNTPGEFILRFDQPRTVDTIYLVNARNNNDRGTNEFKVDIADSENGPWTEVLHDFLPDPRNINPNVTSVPLSKFHLPYPTCGQYVRFKIISWYQWGGGLQYFSTCPLKCEEGWESYTNKCYKKYNENESDISWMNANFNCNNKRGQLASIPNEETNDFINVNVLAFERALIGGFATGQVPNPDLWTWTDGTIWSYMNWAQDRPNNFGGDLELCLDTNGIQDNIGKWNDIVCHEMHAISYICQKYPTY